VTFTDDIIDRINQTINYIHKYVEEKNLSVYTEGITERITVGFKENKLYGAVIFLPTR
jgi:hypothetical protein